MENSGDFEECCFMMFFLDLLEIYWCFFFF